MIFLALLEEAMRYREAYYRDEINLYSEQLSEGRDQINRENGTNGTKQRKFEEKVKGMVLSLKVSMEKFNASCYTEIEHVTKQFSTKADDTFDKYATGFGRIIEHYVDAKSTGEILGLCKAYNEGKLDNYIQTIKNMRNDENKNVISNYTVRSDDDNVSQENRITPTEASGLAAPSDPKYKNNGHDNDRGVQDVLVEHIIGTKHDH